MRADRRDLIGCRIVAGDDRGGISRREMKEKEHAHADERHDDDEGGEAVGHIGDHRVILREPTGLLSASSRHVFSMFQKGMSSGIPITPLTLARMAAGCR